VQLPPAPVVRLAVNPSRRGWSVAALSADHVLYLLRLPEDPVAEAGWDPLGGPPPAPSPVPRQPAGDEAAVFPRVEADARNGVDTDLVAIHFGDRAVVLALHMLDDEGRVMHRVNVQARPGQRVKLSLAKLLLDARILSFDGYLVVDGGDRRDLILEGVLRRRGAEAEALRPHWR
ncbi:MAG: hypothetical protein ACREID_09505, partial [Planctomycetota bacterium]